jgi:hypothetical protein
MTAPHANLSIPHLLPRLIDARWLLGSFVLGLLLASSVSLASPVPSATAMTQGKARMHAVVPAHGRVRPGKTLASSPRYEARPLQGRTLVAASHTAH